MKLLHVHDFFAPGNGRYGFEFDRRMAARGHEIHVLAGVGDLGPAEGTVVEKVTFHSYPYGFNRSSIQMYRHAVASNNEIFTRLQKQIGFDTVLFNQPLCARGVLKSPAARDVRKAYSFISPWAGEWEVAHPQAGFMKRAIHMGVRNRLEDDALAACGTIFVVSRYMHDRLKSFHPSVPETKIQPMPGGVDLKFFSPEGSMAENRKIMGVPETGRLLVTVRRHVPRMGIGNLISAMSQIVERVPDVTLVIGGDGPLRMELEKQAERLKGRIRFLGYIPDEKLPILYRAADLFVLPTLDLEGFGLVAVEAMACGTPVMGTPVGAIPEVLEPFDRGMLFQSPEPGAIAEGVLRFLEGGDREALRRRCREYAAAHYDWEGIVDRAEKALQ